MIRSASTTEPLVKRSLLMQMLYAAHPARCEDLRAVRPVRQASFRRTAFPGAGIRKQASGCRCKELSEHQNGVGQGWAFSRGADTGGRVSPAYGFDPRQGGSDEAWFCISA